MAKSKFIQTDQHAIIGELGAPGGALEPGDKVPFNEDSESHKEIERRIDAGDPAYAHLSIVEIDAKAEQKQQEELDEQLEKAEKIAAEQRNEEAQKATEALEKAQEAQEDGPPIPQIADQEAIPPQDKEAQKLAKQSGAGQRATTQEDVVDEGKSRRGRRSSQDKG